MRVATSRLDLSVAENHLNLVHRAARLDHLGREPVPKLMGRHDPLDPGPTPERRHDLSRAPVAHRPAEITAT